MTTVLDTLELGSASRGLVNCPKCGHTSIVTGYDKDTKLHSAKCDNCGLTTSTYTKEDVMWLKKKTLKDIIRATDRPSSGLEGRTIKYQGVDYVIQSVTRSNYAKCKHTTTGYIKSLPLSWVLANPSIDTGVDSMAVAVEYVD